MLSRVGLLLRFLLLAAFACLLVAGAAHAQPHDMIWEGEHKIEPGPPVIPWVTGSGSTDGFTDGWSGWTGPRSHWIGRPIWGLGPDSEFPGIVETQGPMPGDSLSFLGFWVDSLLNGKEATKRSIFGATHTGMGPVSIRIYATFTGGTIESDYSIFVGDQENFLVYPDEHRFLPFDAVGVNWSAPEVVVNTRNYINLDSGTILSGETVNISGGEAGSDPPYRLDDGQVAKVQLRLVSEIHAGVLNVRQSSYSPFLFNVEDASKLQGLGLNIGFDDFGPNSVADVQLKSDSTAEFAQFIIVGNTGRGELHLSGSAQVLSPDAYEIVGLDGQGDMYVADHSEVHVNDLQVGVRAQGYVAVDTGGRIKSEQGRIGDVAGFEGTVNLEDDGEWETGDLNVGVHGTGYIFVRNGGTLKINGEAVLGKETGSRGVLNLIGSTAVLELGAGGSLTIGDKGIGEVNLSEGATYTSQAMTQLGNIDGGTGTLTVDGPNTKWTATGGLKIGEHGTGHVEIRNQAQVSSSGDSIVLGAFDDGKGTLLIDGDGSEFDFSGELTVGDQGEGTVTLQGGADYTTGDLTLGKSAGGKGTLEVRGSSDTTFVAQGNLKVGKDGRGLITVDAGGKLTVEGDAVFGEGQNSGTEAEPNTATIKGDKSVWATHGNVTIGMGANSYARVKLENDGALSATGTFFTLGEGANSTGILEVSGTSQQLNEAANITGDLRIGVRGTGKLLIGGGVVVRAKYASLGIENNSSGTISISGQHSKLSVEGDIDVGGFGTGDITISDRGQLHVAGLFGMTIDSRVADGATVTVTGGDGGDSNHSGLFLFYLRIAKDGYGSLFVNDNAVVGNLAMEARVASEQNSRGRLAINNLGAFVCKNLEAGAGGFAEVTVASYGQMLVEERITLGSTGSTGSAIFSVTDGAAWTSQFVAHASTTTTIASSGELTIGELASLSGTAANPATLDILTGGTLTDNNLQNVSAVVSAGTQGKAVVNVNTGGSIHAKTFTLGAADGTNQSTATVTGSNSIINAVDVTVNPAAVLTAAGGGNIQAHRSATINGVVDVRGGTMAVGVTPQDGPQPPLGAVTVLPSGILKGSGAIQGDLYALDPKKFPHVTGQRKPLVQLGTSPGILTVEGDVVLEEDTILEMEIGGLTPGTQHDQLVATGSITANGILDLAIVNSGGGFQLPGVGDQFTLLSATDGVSAAFQNAVALKSIAGGWLVDWSLSTGTSTSVLQAVAITPLIDGDYNGDGNVDAADYVVWRKAVGGINLAADGNRDGVIDDLDHDVWRAHFGESTGGGAAVNSSSDNSAVPEPSTAVLLGFGLFALASGIRRRVT